MKSPMFLMLAGMILAGCSSTPTKVDTGPIHASTFNFVRNGSMGSAEFADNDAKIHAMVQKAITTRLANVGVTRATGTGDLTVAYLIIVGNNASVTSINDYFGYGRDALALMDKAQTAYAVDNDNPNYFVAGTLVIDIVDSRSYKLLKRSYVVRPVLADVTDEVRAARIQEAVDEALSSLKISH